MTDFDPQQEQADEAFAKAYELDRRGCSAQADREFARAAKLDPAEYRTPLRLSNAAFDDLVEKAIDTLPGAFKPYLEDVVVVVRDFATAEETAATQEPNEGLLGLYEGIPRTERGTDEAALSDRVIIFKREHEIAFPDRTELIDQVRRTVIHEIGHHFGLGEDDMGEYA